MSSVITSGIADRVRAAFPAVEKFPLSGPDGLRTNWYGLFRMDTGTAVGPGSVSSRYVPHTGDDCAAIVEAMESAFGEVADVKCGFRNGHFLSVEPALSREKRLELYENDVVFPRLIVDAPYGSTFKASIGVFRIICSNLYTLREVEGVTVNIRHTFGLRSKMNDLIEDLSMLRNGWDALSTHIRSMTAAKAKTADFLDAMYGQPSSQPSRGATIHRNRTEAIIRRLARERVQIHGSVGDLQTATAWELLNSIQGFLQHTKPRKGNVTGFERIVLANDDPTVRKAERLLMSMAV